jgi:MraZ protein
MLRGNALAKVDDKGRLKLPAHFRSILVPRFGKEFFVTSIRGDCVHIIPLEVYTAIEEQMLGSSFVEPKVNKLRRALSYYGQMANLDGQGRILIHPLLREQASIDGDVCVFGHQNHLQVWNRTRVEKKLVEDPLTDEELGQLSTLGF